VLKHKAVVRRTALRYTIEKMPDEVKKRTNEKSWKSYGKEKETTQRLIPTFLRILVRAHDKKGFHQDLNQGLTWKDDADVEDGFGGAMVALSETTLSAPQDNQKLTAAFIFDQ